MLRLGKLRAAVLRPRRPVTSSAETTELRHAASIRCPAQLSVGFSDPSESVSISARSESITITSTITIRSHRPPAPKPSFPSFPSVKILPAPQHPQQIRGLSLSPIRGTALPPRRWRGKFAGSPSPPSVVRRSYLLGSPIRLNPCPFRHVLSRLRLRVRVRLRVGVTSPLPQSLPSLRFLLLNLSLPHSIRVHPCAPAYIATRSVAGRSVVSFFSPIRGTALPFAGSPSPPSVVRRSYPLVSPPPPLCPTAFLPFVHFCKKLSLPHSIRVHPCAPAYIATRSVAGRSVVPFLPPHECG